MTPPNDEPEDFAALLAEYDQKHPPEKKKKALAPGDVVRGRILSIGSDAVFLDLGGKSDGMLELVELRDRSGQITVKVGDELEARVVEVGGAAGVIVLKRALGRGAEGKAELEQAYQHQIPVEGLVTAVNKGGVEVQVAGVRAFCPISQLELRHVEDASGFVGQRYQFRITRYDASGRQLNIVLSRRAILEEESAVKAAEVRGQLTVGAVVKGRVSGVKEYGVFVDLGGIEGMLHVSELSFQRVTDPKEMFSVGQELEVQIIKVEKTDDPKRPEKIGLSLKSLAQDPWADMAARVYEGARFSGKVARLETFGAFIEIAPGVDGLMHISELAQGKHLRHAREAVKVGDEIAVIVLGVEPERRRIALGRPTKDDEESANMSSAPVESTSAKSLGTFADLLAKSQKKNR